MGGEGLKPKWTGDLVGKMHINGVTYEDLGNEIGWTKAYVCMILNDTRQPDGAREKLEAAYDSIIKRREEDST